MDRSYLSPPRQDRRREMYSIRHHTWFGKAKARRSSRAAVMATRRPAARVEHQGEGAAKKKSVKRAE